MDDGATLRDPRLEARAANTAYAQARAILEAEPQISAAELVERLRQHAAELADHTGAGSTVGPASTPRVPDGPDRSPSGLSAAAAEARERLTRPAPVLASDDSTTPDREP